jgi:hypothetical protein
MTKLPVIPVPAGFRFQSVDAGEVAARLVELALGTPAGLAPDIAGPRVYSAADLLRGYLRARRKHRLMVPVRLPGKAARATGTSSPPRRPANCSLTSGRWRRTSGRWTARCASGWLASRAARANCWTRYSATATRSLTRIRAAALHADGENGDRQCRRGGRGRRRPIGAVRPGLRRSGPAGRRRPPRPAAPPAGGPDRGGGRAAAGAGVGRAGRLPGAGRRGIRRRVRRRRPGSGELVGPGGCDPRAGVPAAD